MEIHWAPLSEKFSFIWKKGIILTLDITVYECKVWNSASHITTSLEIGTHTEKQTLENQKEIELIPLN